MLDPLEYAETKLNQPEKDSKPGPRTPAGKARSAQNATRHGLAGRVVVLPSEDMNLFHEFSAKIVANLQPATDLEHEIAQTIADGYWRLRRVRTTEDAMFALGHDEGHGDFDADNEIIHAAFTAAKAFRHNPQAFATLSIYEQRILRGIEKASTHLLQLQTERKEQRKQEIAEAIRLRDLNKSQDLPYQPADDGFVYSSEEIEREAHLRNRRLEALQLAKRSSKVVAIESEAA